MRRYAPLIILALILIVTRIIAVHGGENLANLQPLGALFFCAIAYYRPQFLWIPLTAWLLTFSYTNIVQGYGFGTHFWIAFVGLAAIVATGSFFRGRSTSVIFLGSLLSAVIFYLSTNSISWFMDPGYAKTWQGFGQALWSGLPGYPPTWIFFRNSLISTGLFTVVFMLAHQRIALPALAQQEAKEKQLA